MMTHVATRLATIDDLIVIIRRLQDAHRPLVVAIDGAGGAGKSTLASALVTRLSGDAIALSMDDFIVRDRALDDSWEHAWDRGRLIEQVLDPIREGRPVMYQRLEWERNRLSSPIFLRPSRIVIVEGITSLHPHLDAYWHLRIWVEADAEVALERGRARDADTENAQYWDLWSRNDARYRENHVPHERADVVVQT